MGKKPANRFNGFLFFAADALSFKGTFPLIFITCLPLDHAQAETVETVPPLVSDLVSPS